MSRHDRNEILRACQVLFTSGQVVELRALDAVTREWRRPHTASGYFNDWEKLAAAAVTIQARGIYVTLNPVNPALLARANNRVRDMQAGDASTSDNEPHQAAQPDKGDDFAALRAVFDLYGCFRPAPPDPPWADPRPDLAGDHARWELALELAYRRDASDPEGGLRHPVRGTVLRGADRARG